MAVMSALPNLTLEEFGLEYIVFSTDKIGEAEPLTAHFTLNNTSDTDMQLGAEWRVLLSGDAIASSDDRVLASGISQLMGGDGENISVTFELPASLPLDSYNVIALFAEDAARDAGGLEDNQAIIATSVYRPGPMPDLELTQFDVTFRGGGPQEVSPGELLELRFEYTGNEGALEFPRDPVLAEVTQSTDVAFYLSTDATITTDDTLLTSWELGTAPANTVQSDVAVANLPTAAQLPDGQYYIGAIIDTIGRIAESDETNNVAPQIISFTIGETVEQVARPEITVVGAPRAGVTMGVQTAFEDTGDLDDFAYQWLRDDILITGATGTRYLLGPDDLGAQISVLLTYTRYGEDSAASTESVYSDASDQVLPLTLRAEPVDNGTLQGTDADERFTAGTGHEKIIGNGGKDLLQGNGGNDTLISDMLDANLTGDLAGQVFRMYRATLDRTPDATGYNGWIVDLFEGALTLSQMADGFVRSPEFRNTYGALDDAGFVTLLYQNVLGRTADTAGLQGWLDALDTGATRAAVVVGFSQSDEFKRNTADASEIFADSQSQANWSDEIYRAYRATLDRDPDLGGFQGWAELLGSGMTFDTMINGFVTSPEFTLTYGALDNSGFVELLYQNVLGRTSDASGLQGWLDLIDNGTSRAGVVRGFSQSAEFRNTTADDLTAWMRGLGSDDMLESGQGDDILAGGLYSDIFVFNAGETGTNTVLDFEPWDYVSLRDFGYRSVGDAQVHFFQRGMDVIYNDQDIGVVFHDTTVDIVAQSLLI